jgi:hypothetical protein
MSVRILGLGVGLVALGLAHAAAPPDGPEMPAKDFDRIASADIKIIQGMLVKDKLDKKMSRRVKMASLVLAQMAQSNMTKENAASMATLRDQALAVLKAMDDENIPEARAKAKDLVARPKPASGVKAEPIVLHTYLEFDVLMRMFSSEKFLGGFSLEKQLEELVDKPGAFSSDEIITIAQKIRTIAELAKTYPKQDEPKGKTRKAWITFSEDLRATSLALAEAVRTKRDLVVAGNAVSLSCTKCHDVFKGP